MDLYHYADKEMHTRMMLPIMKELFLAARAVFVRKRNGP